MAVTTTLRTPSFFLLGSLCLLGMTASGQTRPSIANLQAQIAALQSGNVNGLANYLTIDATIPTRPIARFQNVNVQIVNGAGISESANGRGNLILGYNEVRAMGQPECSLGFADNQDDCVALGGVWAVSHKSGSHNVVIGSNHNYSESMGLVTGNSNTINGVGATVTGGEFNRSSGRTASVSGGALGVASGDFSVVSGGQSNVARNQNASVSGGTENVANGPFSSIVGGDRNTTTGTKASVLGGEFNTASGTYASVTGGLQNVASGRSAVVVGGNTNFAQGTYAAVGGGVSNRATDLNDTVSGGNNNVASGGQSTVSGGNGRTASGVDDWVAGGLFQGF